jgi:hypothetical protein
MCLRLPSKAKIAGHWSHKIINGRILTYQYSKTSISPQTLTGIMKNRSPLCLFYDGEAAESLPKKYFPGIIIKTIFRQGARLTK